MKQVRFLGDSLKVLSSFPDEVRRECGYQLGRLQEGKTADDFKPMPTIGKGVEEIRVWSDSGTYRVVYTARLAGIVYVLHVFQKKTQQTSQRDIEIAQTRFAKLIRGLS